MAFFALHAFGHQALMPSTFLSGFGYKTLIRGKVLDRTEIFKEEGRGTRNEASKGSNASISGSIPTMVWPLPRPWSETMV